MKLRFRNSKKVRTISSVIVRDYKSNNNNVNNNLPHLVKASKDSNELVESKEVGIKLDTLL